MTPSEQPEQAQHQPEQNDVQDAQPEPGDPLSELGETKVERTASPRDPEAMPSVAGAADPHVVVHGMTPTPVNPDPTRPDPDDDGGPGATTLA